MSCELECLKVMGIYRINCNGYFDQKTATLTRFQRTVGPGEPFRSGSRFRGGSMEPLVRVNRFGPGEPARGSLVRFKRFFPAVLRFRQFFPDGFTVSRFGTCRERSGSGTGFKRFRTGSVAGQPGPWPSLRPSI